MDLRQDEKKLYYMRVVTVWEGLCRLHKELFDFTGEEYLTLLSSDIEKLESLFPIKEEIISRISSLEKERADLITKLNQTGLFPQKITKASELLIAFSTVDQEVAIPALQNLNGLLIEMIQKIQEQNKKNQIFLNKAMLSLREIKQGFTGKKTYTTYGADGMARVNGR